MAKKKYIEEDLIQPIQQHHEADIKRIFQRINHEYFSPALCGQLVRHGYQNKVAKLKKDINDFETELLAELKTNKTNFSRETAQLLEKTLAHFFYDPNAEDQERKKHIRNFWHFSRNSRFNRRFKAIMFGIGGGLFLLGLCLGLIFGTGGAAAIGIGVGIGISLGIGGIGGIIASLIKYISGENEFEHRGSHVREALLELNKEPMLSQLIAERNKVFKEAQHKPKGSAKKAEEKYLPQRAQEREKLRKELHCQEDELWMQESEIIEENQSEANKTEIKTSEFRKRIVKNDQPKNTTNETSESRKNEKKDEQPSGSTNIVVKKLSGAKKGFSKWYHNTFDPIMMPSNNDKKKKASESESIMEMPEQDDDQQKNDKKSQPIPRFGRSSESE